MRGGVGSLAVAVLLLGTLGISTAFGMMMAVAAALLVSKQLGWT